MANPSSIIVATNAPVDPRYAHTYWFKDKAEQSAFFLSYQRKSWNGYTYLRKSWDIKVQATMAEARQWTYLFFQNPDDSKVYYYFVTNIEYINDSTVELRLELDVMQTYLFDMQLPPCFIERQHAATDEIGDNTIDEGLELGELIDAHRYDVEALDDMVILIMSAVKLSDRIESAAEITAVSGEIYNRVFSGVQMYAVDDVDHLKLGALLAKYSEWGKIDGILQMWQYPKALITLDAGQEWGSGDIVKTIYNATFDPITIAKYNNYTLFGGYTPRNNKLYTYPYNFLYATNNTGGTAVYRYERMDNTGSVYTFDTWGCISPEASVRLCPLRYNGVYGYDYGLELGNFPSCAWNSDTYKVWLAQNFNNLNHQGTSAVIQAGIGVAGVIGGAVTGNLAMAAGGAMGALNGLNQIGGLVAQKKDMEVQPAQARGAHSSSVNVAAGMQTFTFIYKCVSGEMARIIDDFFDKYGYKINRVRVPNLHARKRFTFIKTVGCVVNGAFCNDDKRKIADIFDSGLTWWSPERQNNGIYYNTIGNYASYDNDIL